MIRTISLQCPHCGTTSELFLTSNPRIIIFNCPECWTPQLYFDDKIYELTEHQIEVLKNSSGPSSIGHLLNRIVQRKKHTTTLLRARRESAASRNRMILEPAPTGISRHLDHEITADDITNLRIELETCRDSGHFIESI
jgi:hypothetical protein